jgi:hypothetical protein
VVAAVQSEEIGSWGAESVAEEFEILDLHSWLSTQLPRMEHRPL